MRAFPKNMKEGTCSKRNASSIASRVQGGERMRTPQDAGDAIAGGGKTTPATKMMQTLLKKKQRENMPDSQFIALFNNIRNSIPQRKRQGTHRAVQQRQQYGPHRAKKRSVKKSQAKDEARARRKSAAQKRQSRSRSSQRRKNRIAVSKRLRSRARSQARKRGFANRVLAESRRRTATAKCLSKGKYPCMKKKCSYTTKCGRACDSGTTMTLEQYKQYLLARKKSRNARRRRSMRSNKGVSPPRLIRKMSGRRLKGGEMKLDHGLLSGGEMQLDHGLLSGGGRRV